MKNLILLHLFAFVGISPDLHAQNGYAMNSSWASYERDSVTVFFDIGFMDGIPYAKELSSLLVVQIFVPNCDQKSFPNPDQSKQLNQFKYALKEHLEIKPKGVVVASETAACQQKLFIYLKDTSEIMDEIRLLREKSPYNSWEIKTSIENSKNWDYYKRHLIPKDLSYEELYMQKMYESLKEDGDSLTTPREITHVFRIENFEERQKFIAYVASKGFSTDHRSFDKLLVIRKDSAAPQHLLPIIKDLRLRAKDLNGEYIGTEIIQVKN